MRIAIIIVSLAVIAVGLIQIRRSENMTRHEIQRLQAQQVELRRTQWDQQVRLGFLVAPDKIRQQADTMSLDLVGRQESVAQTPKDSNRQ